MAALARDRVTTANEIAGTRIVRHLGIVRGISYGVFGPPGEFMPQLRALGAGVARVYVTWSQVEPEPGRYDWTAVAALLEQIEPGDEVWLTVVSASRWATATPSDFLPASPANDMTAYSLFVGSLVAHCAGKVTYWQCNNEPSNAGLWTGGAEAYATQAVAFAKAVRSADPNAAIVLGGCGYDVVSTPAESESRKFFHAVLDAAHVTGPYDYHLHVRVRDMGALDALLRTLKKTGSAAQTQTRLALR